MFPISKSACLLAVLADVCTTCSGLDVSDSNTCDNETCDSASLLQVRSESESAWCARQGQDPEYGSCCAHLSSVLCQWTGSACSNQCQCAGAGQTPYTFCANRNP